jgi:5'-3' exonuclease
LPKRAWIDGDVLHHWSLWGTSELDQYITNVESNIEQWCLSSITEEFTVSVGGKEKNFRQQFYPDYKKTPAREKARERRPRHEAACLEWLKSQSYVSEAGQLEADDVLAIEGSTNPLTTVIITVDKDLLQVPGHHYNPRRKRFEANRFVSPKEAFQHFQLQLFKGDSIDRIPGLPGIGEKTAEKLVEQGLDPIELYRETFGEQWEERFLFNGKLLYLLRTYDDAFSLERYEELKNYANSQRALDFCSEGFESL